MKKRLLVSQQIFWIQIRLRLRIQICSGSCADPENSVSLFAASGINVFHVLLKGDTDPCLSLPSLDPHMWNQAVSTMMVFLIDVLHISCLLQMRPMKLGTA